MEALELGGVGQLGAGLYQETDPEGLQPSASHPGSPEAHHDAGEGMCQAMQEWQHMSTVERMAFYEMAAK